MKIAIIGAGNIGSSIVKNLAPKGYEISIFDPDTEKVQRLVSEFPRINACNGNADAVNGADVIFVVVKPYAVESVIYGISDDITRDQIIISTAAGIGTDKLESFTFKVKSAVYYIIPNIAISKGESMTFMSSSRSSEAQDNTVMELLSCFGKVMRVREEMMGSFMALSSCGIAYAMRYVRACMCGAIELGIKGKDAQYIICQTLRGAVSLLEDGMHPEELIDSVSTPGGFTIKGLNAMEANGFTTSVIEGIKASKI